MLHGNLIISSKILGVYRLIRYRASSITFNLKREEERDWKRGGNKRRYGRILLSNSKNAIHTPQTNIAIQKRQPWNELVPNDIQKQWTRLYNFAKVQIKILTTYLDYLQCLRCTLRKIRHTGWHRLWYLVSPRYATKFITERRLIFRSPLFARETNENLRIPIWVCRRQRYRAAWTRLIATLFDTLVSLYYVDWNSRGADQCGAGIKK